MAIMRRNENAPVTRRSREWDPLQTMRDLIGWDPFQEMAPRLWRGEERLAFAPAFDVKETADSYLFKADLPGFREGDVEINVTGNRLGITGKREEEREEDTGSFFLAERTYGTFTRTFTLPEGVNADQVRADLKDGVLTLVVPKSEESQPKKITIGSQQSGEKKGKA